MLIYNLFFPYIKEHFLPHTKASQLDQPYCRDSEGGIIFINSHLKKMHQTGVWGTHYTGGGFVFLVRHRAKIQLQSWWP